MNKFALLLCASTFAGSLFANDYYDNLKNALYAAARTNALLLVRQQTPSNTSDTAASLVNASFDGGFNDSTAITNTLYRTFVTKNSTASTTTTTNATAQKTDGVTTLLNTLLGTPSSTRTQQSTQRQQPPRRHQRQRQQW